MRKLLSVLGVLMCSLSAFAEPVKLMVFGDSLSAGHRLKVADSFWFQLDKALKKDGYNVDVMNYSQSGETTGGALHKIKGALSRKPDGVIVQFGSNDMFQHWPLERTKQNLQAIINTFKKAGIPVLLVGMEVPLTETPEYREGTRQMYANLALENELLLYPFFMDGLWKEDGTHQKESYFLPDKLHPSAEGVAIMVKRILPIVEQFLHEDVAQEERKQ